jgi:hypothetical protein
LQPGAFGRGYELAPRSVHFEPQLAHVLADFRPGLYDRLMHLLLNLVTEASRSGGRKQLHYVGAQLQRFRVNDLEFLFDTDGEAVSHA